MIEGGDDRNLWRQAQRIRPRRRRSPRDQVRYFAGRLRSTIWLLVDEDKCRVTGLVLWCRAMREKHEQRIRGKESSFWRIFFPDGEDTIRINGDGCR
jgi:hypothetical protein